MSKTTWGVIVSALFTLATNAGIPFPISEEVKRGLAILAWITLIFAGAGWCLAHLRCFNRFRRWSKARTIMSFLLVFLLSGVTGTGLYYLATRLQDTPKTGEKTTTQETPMKPKDDSNSKPSPTPSPGDDLAAFGFQGVDGLHIEGVTLLNANKGFLLRDITDAKVIGNTTENTNVGFDLARIQGLLLENNRVTNQPLNQQELYALLKTLLTEFRNHEARISHLPEGERAQRRKAYADLERQVMGARGEARERLLRDLHNLD